MYQKHQDMMENLTKGFPSNNFNLISNTYHKVKEEGNSSLA